MLESVSSPAGDAVVGIKGTALKSTVLFIQQRMGAKGMEELLAALSPEVRETVSRGILAGTYYPIPWLIEIQQAAAGLLGGEPRQRFRDFGRFSAEKSLGGAYRLFMKVGFPEYVLGKAAKLFENSFQGVDCNVVRVLHVEKGAGRMQIDRFPGGHADLCDRLDGYFEQVLLLSGAKTVRVNHVACAWRDGTPCCEWEGTWG